MGKKMAWTGRFVRFFRKAKTGLVRVAKWLFKVVKWLRSELIKVAKWFRGELVKVARWLRSKIVKVGKGFCWLLGKAKAGLVKAARWLRSELARVAKWLFKVAEWLWGKLVVAGKWLVATMASENKKAIRSYAIGAGVLLLIVWLVDFVWDINILSRWWLVKILLCPPALFLISLAQKRWEEEKIPVMWGLVKFFVIVIFAGWIIRSQDTRDFVNWCKGPASAAQVSKQWVTVFGPKTYPGKGYGEGDSGAVVTDYAGKQIIPGDKIIVSGKEFEVWEGRWVRQYGKYEVKNQYSGSESTTYEVKAPEGVEFEVRVERFM